MITRKTIETYPPRSISWANGHLVDWINGGQVINQEGTPQAGKYRLAFEFDSAKTSADGQVVVVYKKLGTKGVILKNGEVLREINRSFYHANVYEYPIEIIELPELGTAIVHCPVDYCELQIELVETGEILTDKVPREASDIFHSRLQSNNKYLLSAGWVWHPYDILSIYKIKDALNDPTHIDASGLEPEIHSEVSSARFYGENQVLITTSGEQWDEEEVEENIFTSSSIGLYDIEAGKILKQVKVEAPFGNAVPINIDFALDLYLYPKVINLNTGKVEEEFPSIKTGNQISSILRNLDQLPSIAIDRSYKKIAITTPNGVEVLEINS